MVRYADDFVILCPSQEEAQNALTLVQQWVDDKGLTLHPDKTQVGNCVVEGQGFEFLGYRFEAGKRWVRKKSLQALKDKIRSKTKRTRGDSMETIIKDLNPMLKGWFNYFKHAHKWTFSELDGFIRRRLRSLRHKQRTGQADFGRSKHLQQLMPNAYFANLGLFTMAGSRYFCESFYGHPCPTSGKNYATAYAFGGPSRPASLVGYPTRGIQHRYRNDSTRFRKACIFTTQKALRENTCPIASGDYSTPVSQRKKLIVWHVNPDEEILDWRAVCGRTARAVRREGGW